MKTVYKAGQDVPPGIYVSARHIDFQVVSNGEHVLTGKPGIDYRRVPILAAVLAGPVLGGIFALGFPVLIFLAFAQVMIKYVLGFRMYRAGEQVNWGVYLSARPLALKYVDTANQTLRAPEGARFLRVPTWFLVLTGPAIGALYVVAFPVILVGALASALTYALGYSIALPARRFWENYAYLARFRYEPAASYLSPTEKEAAKTEEKPAETPAAVDPEIGALEAEVAARKDLEASDSPDCDPKDDPTGR